MTTLFIVEYKAFQPINETNIIGHDPITKKDDATGVLITMTKRQLDTSSAVFNIIVENPNNVPNTITGNLEVPFPEKNGKTQIIKINNVIEFMLSVKYIEDITTPNVSVNTNTNASASTSVITNASTSVITNASINKMTAMGDNILNDDFIPANKKSFADKVKNSSKSTTELNMYKNANQSRVSIKVNPKLNKSLYNIIDKYRDEINKDRCFRFNEKSNCLISASYKNIENIEVCKQCKNKLVLGAKKLNITEYQCSECSDIVYIGDNGLPNHEKCNSCLGKAKTILKR